MKTKRGLRYCAVIGAAIVFAALLELFVYNRHALTYPEHKTAYTETNSYISRNVEETEKKLSEEETNSILVARENAEILAQLNGTEYEEAEDQTLVEKEDGMYRKRVQTTFRIIGQEPLFIHDMVIRCNSMEADYEVSVSMQNGETERALTNRSMDRRIGQISCSVDDKAQKFLIVFTGPQEVTKDSLEVTAYNRRSMNSVRLLFFFVLFMGIGFFIVNIEWFENKPEHVFALCSLLLGGLLIYAIGTNQVGYDEHIHMKQAYELSFGNTVLTTESAMQMEGATFPSFYSTRERKFVEDYAEVNHDFSWANITSQSRFIDYDVRAYLPAALFIKLGRAMHLDFTWMIMLGKLGGLLLYTAVVWLAVRMAKQGKYLVGALGLLPGYLFAAATFTYDGILNAFFLLAVVLTTNLLLEKQQKMTGGTALLILLSYIMGSTVKPIYILMSFILLFLSKTKFRSRGAEAVFKICVAAIGILMIYTFFFPPVSASSNYEIMGNLAYAGDKRSQGTSVLGQIEYILHNPAAYAGILLKSMFGETGKYLSGARPFLEYGYLGGMSAVWTWICGLTLCMGAVFAPKGEKRDSIDVKYKILNLFMIFGMSAVIWTSMYVTFTKVGSSVIDGVQGRYFMPLFLPFLYCLMNRKATVGIAKKWYSKIIFAVFFVTNLCAIYQLVIIPRNW